MGKLEEPEERNREKPPVKLAFFASVLTVVLGRWSPPLVRRLLPGAGSYLGNGLVGRPQIPPTSSTGQPRSCAACRRRRLGGRSAAIRSTSPQPFMHFTNQTLRQIAT